MLLTFAIVGGGPTGVEFAGAVAELFRGPLQRDFHALDLHQVRLLLLQQADRLLEEFPPDCSEYAATRLCRMGVEIHLGTSAVRVTADSLVLDDGATLPTGTVIWTAGARADPLPASWGLSTDRSGRILVAPTLQVPDRPEVYVIGDLASVRQGEASLPMLASVAIQEGEAAARNIGRQLEGREPGPFRYRDRGVLATIGRNAAVVRRGGMVLKGFPAWVLWLTVHIFYLIGFRRRVSVTLSWALDYFLQERAVRLILPGRTRPTGPPRDLEG